MSRHKKNLNVDPSAASSLAMVGNVEVITSRDPSGSVSMSYVNVTSVLVFPTTSQRPYSCPIILLELSSIVMFRVMVDGKPIILASFR